MADNEPQINAPDDKEFFTLDELYTKIDSGSGEALLDRGMKYLYDKKYIIEEMIDYAIDNQQDPIEFLYKKAEDYNLHEKEDIKILGSMLKNSHIMNSFTDTYVMLSNIILELKRGLHSLSVKKGNIVEGIIEHIEEIPKLFKKKKEALEEKLKKADANHMRANYLLKSKQDKLLMRYIIICLKIDSLISIYNPIEFGLIRFRYTDILSKFTQSEKSYLEKKLEKLYKFFYVEEEEEEIEEDPMNILANEKIIQDLKKYSEKKRESANMMSSWISAFGISALIMLAVLWIKS